MSVIPSDNWPLSRNVSHSLFIGSIHGNKNHYSKISVITVIAFFCFSDRAKILKGIPDAVAIMEGKVSFYPQIVYTILLSVICAFLIFFPRHSAQSLCLTCFIDGTPDPEIIWLKGDKEIVDQGQFTISREHKGSTITINNVRVENSGKYSVFVRNEYGSEKVDVTVSIYKCGETPPENAVKMG